MNHVYIKMNLLSIRLNETNVGYWYLLYKILLFSSGYLVNTKLIRRLFYILLSGRLIFYPNWKSN